MTENGELHEEIAYWRREMAAALWFACAAFKVAKSEATKADLTCRIRPILAAFAAADAKEWYAQTCETCGAPIKPGELHLSDGEGIAHCKDHLYGEPGYQMGGTPEEISSQVAEARALLSVWENDDPMPSYEAEPPT